MKALRSLLALLLLLPSLSLAQQGTINIKSVFDTSNTPVQVGDAANNAIRVNVVAGGASGGTSSTFGAAFPGTGTAAGFSDGTNMQGGRVFDVDTGAGTQYVAGVNLRLSASGGSVEFGTSTNPIRVDPTGTTAQPVSESGTWTVQPGNTANTTAWLVTGTGGTFPISGNLTGNQATNTVQLGGIAISLNTGVRDTGTQRVTIATNDVVPASQSGTWTVQPGNTANTTPWLASISQGGNTAAVNASSQLNVNCAAGCSGGPTDESAFTFGTTGIFSGGVFQTTPTANALTTGQAGVFQVTANRALFVNLRTSAGGEVNASTPLAVLDTSLNDAGDPTALERGRMILAAVQRTSPVYPQGRLQPLSLTELGALRIDGSGVTQPVSGTFFQATQPVSGTFFQATQPVSGTVTVLDPTLRRPGDPASIWPGRMVLGSVSPTPPVYNRDRVQPLSLTTLGALRTDSSTTVQPTLSGGQGAGGRRPFVFCDRSASISTASSGNTQLVALVGSQAVYVCGYTFVSTSALAVKFAYGTGANCATGTVDMTGAMAVAANGGVVNPVGQVPTLITPSGQAFCVNLSAATQVSGHITYGQF